MKYTLKLTRARTSAHGHLLLEWTLNPAGWRRREPWAKGLFALDADYVICSEWYDPAEEPDDEEQALLDFVTDCGERAGHLALLLALMGRVTLSDCAAGHQGPGVLLPEAALKAAAKKINAGEPGSVSRCRGQLGAAEMGGAA